MNETKPAPSLQQQPATWDSVAPTYAEDAWQWGDFAQEAMRRLPIAATDRVLDVATGPGTLALLAAERAAHVDAVDFSPGMISELLARATAKGMTNVSAAVMDAQELAFADASFDAAYCMFAFFFFPDRKRAFGELHRVLRAGGRALIATWAPIDRRPVMKIAFEALAETLPHLPRPAKGDLQDPGECVREMSAAGFRGVSSEPYTASTRVQSAEHYVELIMRSAAPLTAMKKMLGDEGWADAKRRLIEVCRRSIPDTGVELAAEAIFTIGTH